MKVWTAAPHDTRITDEQGQIVCVMGVFSEKQDARLIAAAPEMLAALRQIQTWLLESETISDPTGWNSHFVKANDLACAALKKAEGR